MSAFGGQTICLLPDIVQSVVTLTNGQIVCPPLEKWWSLNDGDIMIDKVDNP